MTCSPCRKTVVNAIDHRDYRSTANVQVYVFQDRVEIVTPGGLPAGMREQDLGSRSVPRNPLLFSMLYRMKLVEQIGSGIRRIHDACTEYGAEDPVIDVSAEWVTVTFPRSAANGTPHVERLISVLRGDMSRAEIMQDMELADRRHFRTTYLQPGLDAGLVEMTVPDSPRSRSQRYRLTAMGRQVQYSLEHSGDST